MSTLPKLHILVLMGGWANEREVSLMSGNGVADALEARGHRITRIDMGHDVAARIAQAKPDVVFNALHGAPGEDGTVQGMLDLMGVPYTHSGLATSVIAIDKELTKLVLKPHGIPMPGGRVVKSAELYEADPLARPYVLKPVNEGSSVGVAILARTSSKSLSCALTAAATSSASRAASAPCALLASPRATSDFFASLSSCTCRLSFSIVF